MSNFFQQKHSRRMFTPTPLVTSFCERETIGTASEHASLHDREGIEMEAKRTQRHLRCRGLTHTPMFGQSNNSRKNTSEQVKSSSRSLVSGFTLIEILVVLAILTIMVLLSMASMVALTSNSALKLAKQDVYTSLQKVRTD